jgi:hypothetical protein
MIIFLNDVGNQLKYLTRTSQAYEIIFEYDLGEGWDEGGCGVFASVLSKIFNYPVYAIIEDGIVQHFCVYDSSTQRFLDSEGNHTVSNLKSKYGKNIVISEWDLQASTDQIICPSEAQMKVKKFLERYLNKSFAVVNNDGEIALYSWNTQSKVISKDGTRISESDIPTYLVKFLDSDVKLYVEIE